MPRQIMGFHPRSFLKEDVEASSAVIQGLSPHPQHHTRHKIPINQHVIQI